MFFTVHVSEEHVASVFAAYWIFACRISRTYTWRWRGWWHVACVLPKSREVDVPIYLGSKERSRISRVGWASYSFSPFEQDSRLPPFVCRSCKLKFNTIEAKVENFRAQARSSYNKHVGAGDDGQRKRTKDTSGDTISPFTARSRPPAKRFTTSRCLFPRNESKLLTVDSRYTLIESEMT